jgi:hypothetical protein
MLFKLAVKSALNVSGSLNFALVAGSRINIPTNPLKTRFPKYQPFRLVSNEDKIISSGTGSFCWFAYVYGG